MSHPKPRKPRPLGSLRHLSRNVPEKLPSIPHRLPEINPDTEHLKAGIHGNAMAVPPPQAETTRRSVDDRPKSDKSLVGVKPSKSSMSSASAVSHENCEKEIKEGLAREKDLKDTVSSLTKQIEELKIALRKKEDENKALQTRLQSQEEEAARQLSEEQKAHERTRANLQEVQAELDQAHEFNGRLSRQHAEDMEKQKAELEKRLADTTAEKDAQIADRDQKLSRLKSQMADALKGNSWERQQQLEELTKELSRIQEESDLLRMKIKSLSKNKQGQCSNCDDNKAKVTKLQTQVKEKDATIKELKTLCSKFESQLTTQDKLLEQWASTQGHKITAPK
ncbi:hypothetical protein RRG08_044706 [Elysia crispata]|uniref:Uncharacterized protein n=1 Tax=Elysia crispata TaxID=231223 RepID=A0AAE0XYB7_9GAST|nr:hypothetical protein RRG08_044706 [Elysia crispata]